MKPARCAILSAFVVAVVAPACTKRRAATGSGSTPSPISIEQLLQIEQAGPPVWSPDGTQIGFLWGAGTERDFWSVDMSAAKPARPGASTVRQLAPLVGRSDAVVSPDWKRIAYVSKKQIW